MHDLIQFIDSVLEWGSVCENVKPWVTTGINQKLCYSILTDWFRDSVACNDAFQYTNDASDARVQMLNAQTRFQKLVDSSCFSGEHQSLIDWFRKVAVEFLNALNTPSESSPDPKVANAYMTCIHPTFNEVCSRGNATQTELNTICP